MPINKNEITKEMLEKAMQCKDADELIALAKAEGKEITKEEAEAYLAELDDVELDEAVLNRLISKILVGEVKKIDGQKVQEVRIIYNFVGEIPEITE